MSIDTNSCSINQHRRIQIYKENHNQSEQFPWFQRNKMARKTRLSSDFILEMYFQLFQLQLRHQSLTLLLLLRPVNASEHGQHRNIHFNSIKILHIDPGDSGWCAHAQVPLTNEKQANGVPVPSSTRLSTYYSFVKTFHCVFGIIVVVVVVVVPTDISIAMSIKQKTGLDIFKRRL